MTTGAVAFFKFPCEGEAAAMMTAPAIARTAEGLAALSTTPAADPWRMEVCAAECGERAGNAGAGRGAWVGGLRAKTCAICRLAHRQSRLRWQQGGGSGGRARTQAATCWAGRESSAGAVDVVGGVGLGSRPTRGGAQGSARERSRGHVAWGKAGTIIVYCGAQRGAAPICTVLCT